MGGTLYKHGTRNWPARKVTYHTAKIYHSSIVRQYSSWKGEIYLFHGGGGTLVNMGPESGLPVKLPFHSENSLQQHSDTLVIM